MTYEQYSQDFNVRHLSQRFFIIIIGENANQIPDNIYQEYPEAQWRKIISYRNILVHRYNEVVPAITWQIIREHMPNDQGNAG